MSDTTHATTPDPMLGHNSAGMTVTQRLASDYEHFATDVAETLLRAKALPAPIATDDDLTATTLVVNGLRALARKVEEARTKEKAPYLQAGRDTDAYFGGFAERMAQGLAVLNKRTTAYLNAKVEAERAERERREKEAREAAERAAEAARAAAEVSGTVEAAMAEGTAILAEHRAEVAAAEAAAPVTELAKTRTAAGTVGLKGKWTFEIVALNKIPLAQLRPYLDQAAIEKAIRAFVAKGGRELTGVRIFEEHKASFRAG